MSSKTIMKVMLTLFYAQQTLIFYWCLMSEKITGTLYVGSLSTLIFICSFFGNMTLGPLKGYIDSKVNRSYFGRLIAGVIPQLIFGMLVISIYFENTFAIITNIILWHLIGMPFISANDCLIDEASSQILGSASSFAIVQYIGTKIIARMTFAYFSDYYTKLKSIITAICLISILFGITVHFLVSPYHQNKVSVSSKTKEKNITSNNLSFLIFPPLFMIIFEAVFLDIPLSSLKFITPRFRLFDSIFLSSPLIAKVEIATSIIFMVLVSFSKRFDNMTFHKSWTKYTKLHIFTTICRFSTTIILVYLMNINPIEECNQYYVANVTERSLSQKRVISYAMMTDVDVDIIRFFIILATVLNASIDAISSVMVIVLLKSYAENRNIRYSTLDGWIRLFTYLPIIVPWLKRNPNLSVYNSGGCIINVLSMSMILYFGIVCWNYYRMKIYK